MRPENVRYPTTSRERKYIKNTLPKCYNPPPKLTEVKEVMTKKSGFRRFYITSKEIYRGWWKDNQRHGLGTQISKVNGEVYEGEFLDDKRHGYGVISLRKPNGVKQLMYEGDFANGAPNGKGELYTKNYHYIGQVIDGKASGVGIAWFNNSSIYHGTWFNGKRMGRGMHVYKNRNRYEGDWYDDKKHGFGQYCFFDRGQALEGVWVADVCVRGFMRDIKYRQAAPNPVKYPIPKLMLKDWCNTYYQWEQEAFARVGKYIKEDVGLNDILENEDLKKSSNQFSSSDMKQTSSDHLTLEIDFLHHNMDTKLLASDTEVQPCVIFK